LNKKSLIIGFGNRAKEVVYPALNILGHKIFIYSRNLNKLKTLKDFYNFEIIYDLNSENLQNVDQIFVCTKNDSYENIIKKICNTGLASKITLFIDTPLLFHFFKINKFKKDFKNLVISEDETFDLINQVIKNLINENYSFKLFKINLNYYGLLIHSISQIMNILNLNKDNLIENKITYAFYLNLNKLKYFLKIANVKIFFNYGREWSSDKSNIEIFLKSKKNKIEIKKYKINYLFSDKIFDGFEVNGLKYKNKDLDHIKYNFRSFYEILKLNSSYKYQIKILNFISMVNFYEFKKESNIINYIKGEYFANILNKMRFFINFKIDLIKLRKILYKFNKKI
tara:strand:- start:1282 stop:2301 length:1020 start_codon:yes stop_codon:yes gene_type:complete